MDAEELRDGLRATDAALLEHPQIHDALPQLVEAARAIADAEGPNLAEAATARMRRELEPTVHRLEQLALVNPRLRSADVEEARAELDALEQGLGGVRVRLDALRLIVVSG